MSAKFYCLQGRSGLRQSRSIDFENVFKAKEVAFYKDMDSITFSYRCETSIFFFVYMLCSIYFRFYPIITYFVYPFISIYLCIFICFIMCVNTSI